MILKNLGVHFQKHNLEILIAEDSKVEEDTRSFIMDEILGDCGTGCLKKTLDKHRAVFSEFACVIRWQEIF